MMKTIHKLLLKSTIAFALLANAEADSWTITQTEAISEPIQAINLTFSSDNQQQPVISQSVAGSIRFAQTKDYTIQAANAFILNSAMSPIATHVTQTAVLSQLNMTQSGTTGSIQAVNYVGIAVQ